MNVTVLDTNFDQVAVVDAYKSFIWTDRFDEPGDFELYIPMNDTLPQIYQKGYYLWNADSEHLMIIESRNLETDPEEGAFYAVSGRSIESILDRRVIWNKTEFTMAENSTDRPNLQNGIKKLLDENVIVCSDMPVRKIDNFIFETNNDEAVTKLTFEASYLGEDLLSVVKKLCQENEIGFKVVLNDNDQFVFKLYAGADRSYNQTVNPYVMFSPNYKNLSNAQYTDSDKPMKNVVLVVGETETDSDGNVTSRIDYEFGSAVGLDRRETFTDASSLKLEDDDGGIRTAEEYEALLRKRGIDALMENTYVSAFSGEVHPSVMYTYGKDYNMGDIVQVEDGYGHEAVARITEFIQSHDQNGMTAYPTFTIIQKGVYET